MNYCDTLSGTDREEYWALHHVYLTDTEPGLACGTTPDRDREMYMTLQAQGYVKYLEDANMWYAKITRKGMRYFEQKYLDPEEKFDRKHWPRLFNDKL